MWRPLLLLSLLFCNDLTVAKATASTQLILLPSQHGDRTCSAPDPNLNDKPIIGILTHPGVGTFDAPHDHSLSYYEKNVSYIAASYVKFAETGGARVIPLIYNEPQERLFQKLELVNGVIFTGGWAKEGLYFDIVQKIFGKVLEKNDAGEHFPVYAMCLGFEILSMIISQSRDILERFNSVYYASSLQFIENVNIEGTVFQRFSSELLKKISTDCLVLQNHQFGISPENFLANPSLSSFFSILTTSADRDGKTYVSTIRSKRYPVTAFQWHPEKNAFEWGSSEIPHSEDAIQVTQHAANYLVSEARKSLNRPSSEKVLSNLIYNYKLVYSGYKGSGNDEAYIFT
ncbi:probable gamma-glutamyl hydrolase 3 [Brassica napus]|uniref:probable gamma-glutamyl hydrolase 3 n=1 Tax=Brassica napus TaxID=3708 RepID=UPI0020788D1C|nr:probable gamma-glutamyl hydrolase 3 [Brassica napus]